MAIYTDYLGPLFNKNHFKKIISSFSKILKERKVAFLACSGLSGIIPTTAISVHSGIPFCVVRKSDGSHSSQIVEGIVLKGKKYAIIDDFVDSGSTIERIKSYVDAKLDSIFFYKSCEKFIFKELNTQIYYFNRNNYSKLNVYNPIQKDLK